MASLRIEFKTGDAPLIIPQGATMEAIAGQLQHRCGRLLYVVDGTQLHYFDDKTCLPRDLRFEGKRERWAQGERPAPRGFPPRDAPMEEYYFRSSGDDTLYCVFGRDSARFFYPAIDKDDPLPLPAAPPPRPVPAQLARGAGSPKQNPGRLTLIDGGTVAHFTEPPQHELKITSHAI